MRQREARVGERERYGITGLVKTAQACATNVTLGKQLRNLLDKSNGTSDGLTK
jgi:hypothetical protein